MPSMRKRTWFLCGLLVIFFKCCVVLAVREPVMQRQQKAESIVPITTNSPPEGNTTFLDGATWCVAKPGASDIDLQKALDWACGLGGTDCSPVHVGGPCYQPDTLLAHASFVFNSYYQQNGDNDVACYFGGTAVITSRNPSYGSCAYLSSEISGASSSFPRRSLSWHFTGILLCILLYKITRVSGEH